LKNENKKNKIMKMKR